uniref:Uncharacterized protein n=1 Tax=Bionectria ochroleuca TaxID=29856 RepID=A0A0B7K5X0_BIOOC
MRTPSDSPFLTTVLPLAYMDDLLMHSLLALSGTHLAYKQGSDHGILHATALHYSKALSGLRHEFAHLHDGTSPQEPRLLLVLMMICHYESLSADVGGAVFSHLKASRQLALSLQSRLKSRPDRRTINNEIAGFALEIYAYLLFVNNVTPYGAILNRTLPFDDFVLSLDSLSSFSTFGTMFAGAHELFELIPQVSVLASQSIAEESAGQETPSSELLARAEDLSARISSWTMTETRCTERPGDWEQKLLAAAALQQGLHIYLATAKAGSTVKDPAVAVQIQGHVDVILHIMEMLTDSEFDCTLIWPCVIGGSCMVIPEQQRSFTLRVLNNRHKMKHLKTICDTLQLLWDDDSPSSYGPHGLSVVMARHGHYLAIT